MNINNFKAEVKGGGARPNLFQVAMPFPLFAGSTAETRKLAFTCKAASIPASSVGVIDVPYMGRQMKVPGDRTFAEWSITVINDTDFIVRDAFEKWMNAINSHEGNVGLRFSELLTDAVVSQLDRDGSVLKQYQMKGIFPSDVAAIDLAMAVLRESLSGGFFRNNIRGSTIIRRYWISSFTGDETYEFELKDQLRKREFEPLLFKKDGNKEKGVDMAIAMKMLTNAFNQNYDIGVLIAGDKDYLELVEEVKRYGPRIFGLFPSDGLNRELSIAVDYFLEIRDDAFKSQTMRSSIRPFLDEL